MVGSNIFIVYTSSGGSNVTLSPRLASGYSEPDLNADAEVSLLEGSGVANGVMTANVKCTRPVPCVEGSQLTLYRLELQQLVRRLHGLPRR